MICGRLPDFFHAAKPEASLAIGTDLRNFVSENPQTRIVQDSNGKLLSLKGIIILINARMKCRKIFEKTDKYVNLLRESSDSL